MCFFSSVDKRKQVKNCVLAVIMIWIIGTVSMIEVDAADFVHSHSGACYTTGMASCSSRHEQISRPESSTAHCSNCGTSTPHTVTVRWDKCHGTNETYELGGQRNCSNCGSMTYEWSRAPWNHQILQQILSCNKNSTSTGTLWLQNGTSGWTKGNVILEAGVNIYDKELTLPSQPYSWDNQATWTEQASTEITENGTYIVCVRDSKGTVVTETINVTNIDRTAPSILGIDKSTTEWTNQDILLIVRASDDQPEGGTGSGLAEQAYSFDEGTTYVEVNSLTVSENGTYKVMIKDQLGNVGTGYVEVSNIDKTAPEITGIVPIEEGWQSDSVIMQIQAADSDAGSGLHSEAYSLDGGVSWQSEPTFLISENGKYQAQVRDLVGNIAIQDFCVEQIDATAPIIEEIQVMQDKIYDDKVFVTILATDMQPDGSLGSGLHNKAYSIDGGQSWNSENTFWVEAGKQYDIRVRDALEWESEEYLVERKDFPYPPPKPVTDNASAENTTSADREELSGEMIQEENIPKDNNLSGNKQAEQGSKTQKDIKEEYPSGNQAGMYDYGNWYEKRYNKNVTGKDDLNDSIREESKNIMLDTQMSDMKNTVQVVTPPWYTTTVGKTFIVSVSALAAGIIIGGLFWLYFFSVSVYCVEEKGRLYHLGRVLLHRTNEGYSIYLSNFMLQTATVPKYRLKVSRIILKKVENERLLIESEEKNLEVLMQETIDFEL